MQINNILFFSYWYRSKNNQNFAIFIKRHAHSLSERNKLLVLSINIIKGNHFYKKNIEVFFDEKNIETHQIHLESKFNKLLYVFLPLHYFILKRYIQCNLEMKNKFNIIHSNVLFPCGIVGYWLSKKFNYKHIITEHWSKIDKFFKVSLYKTIGKKTLNKSYTITCVSQLLKKTVQKHTTNQNIHVIPNVIDSSQFYYDTSIQKNNIFTFIAVANWTLPKNPFYFLNALQQIANEKSITNFKLVIVGSGILLENIKQLNYGFDIEYKGVLNPKKLKDELNKSNVFLHGSNYETFSVIIAEALMCCLPSVVSPVGIANEVINITNGFVTNNTVSDWKERILKCHLSSYNYTLISEQLRTKYDSQIVGKLFSEVYPP